ncbi:NUDIX domain-containing protein [Streptomyces sp. NPDC026665]|uniref:NUDIX domain-containing protein n=1 Tax=Streptomyces sp. NPDC026665 TaxID=3154798 RepID=UPI00340A33AE
MGRALLVHPTYRKDDSWQLPGGVVEPGEHPHVTCRREIIEELGLDLPLSAVLMCRPSARWAVAVFPSRAPVCGEHDLPVHRAQSLHRVPGLQEGVLGQLPARQADRLHLAGGEVPPSKTNRTSCRARRAEGGDCSGRGSGRRDLSRTRAPAPSPSANASASVR